MGDARSIVVQSVLYGNAAHDIERAVAAVTNALVLSQGAGLISTWSIRLGDCSPKRVFSTKAVAALRATVVAAGGQLDYTVFGANLGSAAGQNALAAGGDSELLLILNPDAQVAPGTITALCRAVVDSVGIAEGRQVPLEHPKDFEKYTGDTSWASTACALTTREAFDAVGGFDSDTFFLYCDDVDYSWRLRLAGYRVVFEPAARVFHDKRLTVTGDWPASSAEIYYSAEAAILLAHKYSRPDLVKKLVSRYRKQGSEAVLKAVAEYETRKREKRLPEPLDPRHTVAEFVRDNYAVHRF